MMHYKVEKWVSWRVYKTNESRTLILNQKNNKYLILNSVASQIWIAITEKLHNEEKQLPEYKNVIQKLLFENVISCADLSNVECENVHIPNLISVLSSLDSNFSNWVKQNGFIFDVHWDTTNKCNARCIHCYNEDAHTNKRNSKNELNTEEAQNLLYWLKNIGVFRLVFSGGETSLRNDFFELCEKARDLGFQLVIYTNGISFDEKQRERLASLYPLCVAVSIYGSEASIHDRITQVKGSYKNAIETVKHLKQQGIFTTHKNTLLKSNFSDWRTAFEKGKRLASESMINFTIYPSVDSNGTKSISDSEMTMEQLIELALQGDSPIYFKRKVKKECHFNKGESAHPCYDSTSNLYIASNGDIYPCIAFPYKVGSFRGNDFSHIKWFNPKMPFSVDLNIESMEKRWNNWRSLKVKDLKECGKLEYCEYCIDLCPGDAFVLCGDPLAVPENHCKIAIARYTAKCWSDNLFELNSKQNDKTQNTFNNP